MKTRLVGLSVLLAAGIVGSIALREAAAEHVDFRKTMNLVDAAINAKINGGNAPGVERRWFNTEAFFADRVVISLDGRCWSYLYTIDGTAVTLGDAVEVVETYIALKEAAPLAEPCALRMIEAEGVEAGVAWEATLVCAGLSLNKIFYPDTVLREAAPRFEGARIFVKSDAAHIKGGGKDVRDLIGWIESPRFVEGASADAGSVVATIRLPGLPVATRTLLVEATKAGRTDIAGLSIDATGRAGTRMVEGKRVKAAASIDRVDSVDLIVEPGAGGRLVRLVEAAPAITPNHQEISMRTKLLQIIQSKAPALYAKLNVDTATDDEIEVAYREAVAAPNTPQATSTTLTTSGAPAGGSGQDALEQVRMIEARMRARELVAASTLPAPAKERLVADFTQRARFVEADVTTAIEAERGYLARFAEGGRVSLPGLQISVEDRSVKINDMLDAFFNPEHKDHRAVGSFKEAYIEITGDRLVTGQLRDIDRARMRESLGANFREALDSTSWADALGNSITRRMQEIYTGETDLQTWRKVARVGRVADFRTQERVRVGGYGNLPAVAEAAGYVALASPGDDKASYAITKRGGLETVTREMVLNDDVSAIRQIPMELALAAANTLYEFVFDFYRTNPNASDGVALYHATHSNLFTAALDATAFSAHRIAMLKQTRAGSAKRFNVPPAVALVPFELQETAFNLFVRNQNLDKTFVQTINPEVIAVPYWTDATDWVTVADPRKLPVLEIGFLNGQEDPEIFVQDMPNVGSMFSNDKLTYKIRHEYGGVILVDGEKGTTKAVVA